MFYLKIYKYITKKNMFCVERNSNTSIKNLRKVFPLFPNKMHISRPSNLTKYFYCTEIFIKKVLFIYE